MSREAMLPCFVCGKTLLNAFIEADNQPQDGTEFRTYGHYGSTFWDWTEGEELVLTICDDCLRAHTERLAQQKRYLPIKCEQMAGFGRQWIERPMLSYTGNLDNVGAINVEPEELGSELPHVEWGPDIQELKKWLMDRIDKEEAKRLNS
jgi:hypothetical protein